MSSEKPEQSIVKKWQRKVNLLGFFKIPMLWRLHPRLLVVNDSTVLLKIRLRRRSMNHLRSMYFGALTVGADCTAGLHAFYYAEKYQRKISFIFKSMDAQFLKRTETDATFVFNGGKEIEKIVLKSIETGERYNHPCRVEVFDEEKALVAVFTMESSVKVR